METHAESWAVVELMGHIKLAGKLTEVEMFGVKMGRLDIPTSSPCPLLDSESHKLANEECPKCGGDRQIESFATQLFGGQSVYRITIVTEKVARDICKRTQPAPVSPWDYPKLPLKTDTDEVIDPSWEPANDE